MLPRVFFVSSYFLLIMLQLGVVQQVDALFGWKNGPRQLKQILLNINTPPSSQTTSVQRATKSLDFSIRSPTFSLEAQHKLQSESQDLNSWLAWQSNKSFHLILENIGGALTILKESEVLYGMVIASQLRSYPNYFFNWIRDSALTIRTLIYQLNDSHENSFSIRMIIELYIEVNYYLQRQPNKSGKFKDERRSGLGEPKFMPNGQSFDAAWGRPQSDGPALRILTIIGYIDYLENLGNSIDNVVLKNTSNIYRNIIKPDLEYVMANWDLELFDLWEEIPSYHFFNSLVQLKSIKDGMDLARRFDDATDFSISLEEHFQKLKNFILDYDTGFQTYEIPYIVETPSLFHQGKRTGLDAASLLASLHSHTNDHERDNDIPFDIDDSHILNTISSMVTDMKFRYPVNRKYLGKSQHSGVGIGRYPEDIYDGYTTTEGNPWFICTASVAEILYRQVYKRVREHSDIIILTETRDFYALFDEDLLNEDAQEGDTFKIEYGSDEYTKILLNVLKYSDTFMDVIRDHIDASGHMLEQFNKNTGYMQGAQDLTWSYSSFYNSVLWRKKARERLEELNTI